MDLTSNANAGINVKIFLNEQSVITYVTYVPSAYVL